MSDFITVNKSSQTDKGRDLFNPLKNYSPGEGKDRVKYQGLRYPDYSEKKDHGINQVPHIPTLSYEGKPENLGRLTIHQDRGFRISAVINDSANRRKLEDINFSKLSNEKARTIYNAIDDLDFSTNRDEVMFYSGIKTVHAVKIAKFLNKKTIEMTTGGKWLDDQNLFERTSGVSRKDAVRIWRKASARYAAAAKGNVTAFEKVRVYKKMRGSAFRGVEAPILESFGSVDKIFYKGYHYGT